MNKTTARKMILHELNLQKSSDSDAKSSKIKQRLLSSGDFSKAKDVFVYISKDTEVDTRGIIEASLKQGKGVYCPITGDKQIKAGRLTNTKDLKPGKFGILEPQKITRKNKFDIIIVPGVAFGKNGSRLGRGGGYFDRFLSASRGKKTALAFDFQVLDGIENEKHDVLMDKIITEKRIFDIKKHAP